MDAGSKRLYYIDWLRVMAFGLLFLFHALRFFDSYPWHIKNAESSILINYFVEFTHSWRMQIVFLVSGAGTYFALRSRKAGFLKDRTFRLVIPFIFSIIILIPPQKYLEAISQMAHTGSLWSFLEIYPTTLFNENIGFSLAWAGHIGYHVWYLAYLFIQTILFLPLLNIVKNSSRIKSAFNKLTSTLLGLWSMILPFVVLEFILRPLFPGYLDWADFAIYSLFFLYGFMFQLSDTVIAAIEKFAYLFLLTGVMCWGAYLLNKEALDQMSTPVYSISYMLTIVLKNINSFSWVMAFLALGKKFLNFRHWLLNDLNQGILPFYILHQTVIVIFGYFVVQWDLSILEKFLIILTTSFIVTIGLYQIIRRNNVMRLLFGMKRKGVNPANEEKQLIKTFKM